MVSGQPNSIDRAREAAGSDVESARRAPAFSISPEDLTPGLELVLTVFDVCHYVPWHPRS